MRPRAVIDKVAQAPEVIKVLLWKGLESSEVAMNIGNDGYLHKAGFPQANGCEGRDVWA
jgi:hypothetical protein